MTKQVAKVGTLPYQFYRARLNLVCNYTCGRFYISVLVLHFCMPLHNAGAVIANQHVQKNTDGRTPWVRARSWVRRKN